MHLSRKKISLTLQWVSLIEIIRFRYKNVWIQTKMFSSNWMKKKLFTYFNSIKSIRYNQWPFIGLIRIWTLIKTRILIFGRSCFFRAHSHWTNRLNFIALRCTLWITFDKMRLQIDVRHMHTIRPIKTLEPKQREPFFSLCDTHTCSD